MALTDKLTAIANAIRSKSGKTGTLTLDQMPTEIEALSAEEIIKHAEIPDYVKAEALKVANKVNEVRTDDSIVFLAMSDSHHYGTQGESGVDTYVDTNGTQTNTSNLHSAMAAKILAYALNIDFMAHLGDASWGNKTTTSALLNSQIDALFGMLGEAHADIPCFHAIGNHDTGYYYKNNGGVCETGENLYNKFTARSASDNTVFGDNMQYGGYCYRDFPDKKFRVYLLNTSEYHIYNGEDKGALGSQLKWFAQSLMDLNLKTDADKWKFIVLSHYPADYGSTMPLSNVIKAYVTGSGTTISLESNSAYLPNFSGYNKAKFIAQFHGHIHNFLASKLHISGGAEYDAWRVSIPNGQFNRENDYGLVSGINFGEDEDYIKTANSANDTSFVVNVVNPNDGKIYSFCYGAGYDRRIVIDESADDTVEYTISSHLTKVNISASNSGYIEAGKSFSATLTPHSGYALTNVNVSMGEEDVTDSVYWDGKITIATVTGDIVITAKAEYIANYTNVVSRAVDTDGSIFNDGLGYIDNYRMSSDHSLSYYDGSGTSSGPCVTTGYIPITPNTSHTIRIAGEGISGTSMNYGRLAFYDANFNPVTQSNGQATAPWSWNNLSESAGFTVTEEAETVLTVTVKNTSTGYKASYVRICVFGKGENLIVTIDEPIE